MNRHYGGGGWSVQRLFCLRFQERMRELLELGFSAAEGFGPAWEAALDAIPLVEEDQAIVYRELIRWAKGGEVFTRERAVACAPPSPRIRA